MAENQKIEKRVRSQMSVFSMSGSGLFFKNLPKSKISVLQKRAAYTKCDLWVCPAC